MDALKEAMRKIAPDFQSAVDKSLDAMPEAKADPEADKQIEQVVAAFVMRLATVDKIILPANAIEAMFNGFSTFWWLGFNAARRGVTLGGELR